MQCSSCGTANPDSYRFCGTCGTPLFVPENSIVTETDNPPGLKGDPCFVCQNGSLQSGKRFFITTDAILACESCKTEYHKHADKYVLKKVPEQFTRWHSYEGQPLSEDELQRISLGGVSDAELAKQEEEQQRERARLAEEERLRSTPGTPQCFIAQFKRIVGMPEDSSSFRISVTSSSADEAKKHIQRFAPMQKELRQLKREVNAQIKLKRDVYKLGRMSLGRGSKWERAELNRKELVELTPYQAVISNIDNAILSIDKGLMQIENNDYDAITTSTEGRPEEKISEKYKSNGQETRAELRELLAELDALVGLDSVKHELVELINFLKVQQVRKAKGLPELPLSLHTVFYGNPGTGKTTVARLLAQIYRTLGILGKGHLIETDRSGLVAGYVGQTALKVRGVVEKALGGILFVDEAYALAPHSDQDFGAEAINTLVKLMEDHRNDLIVVVAGYTDEMNEFIESNPGLRSRFNRFWKFDDYTPDQLVEITESFFHKGGFKLTDSARQKMFDMFQQSYDQRDKSFGNARLARNLFESAISNQATRIVNSGYSADSALSLVEPEDITDEFTSKIR